MLANEEKIGEILDRGVSEIYPSKDFLSDLLKQGKKLTVYCGYDPTGPSLHIGHAITLIKLRQFQELGHRVIFLIGDFTATIGDPTDKSATRKILSRDEVMSNAVFYKEQAEKIISFSGSNAAQVRYNSNWLKDMTLEDSIKILANLTYAQTIKRDMFQKRIEDGKDLYLHEFMYPMMQAYDSVAMDVDGEVGGNDQVFNMLVGRDLMKKMKNKGKFVLALKLLADQSGKKMGKTEGNMVALNERPEQIFGKVMSWGDSMIMLGFELCTLVPWAELAGLKDQLDKGVNPRDLKLKLAEEIVSICHSKPAALAARTSFLSVFAEGVMPENATEIEAAEGGLLVEEALKSGIVFSKSEFRRLIDEGAVKDMESGQKITDVGFKVKQDSSFKIGKHRFLKIKIK